MLFLCNYNFAKLPLKLPRYNKKCLIAWTLLNKSNRSFLEEIANQIIWNNQYICVNGKSVCSTREYSLKVSAK